MVQAQRRSPDRRDIGTEKEVITEERRLLASFRPSPFSYPQDDPWTAEQQDFQLRWVEQIHGQLSELDGGEKKGISDADPDWLRLPLGEEDVVQFTRWAKDSK